MKETKKEEDCLLRRLRVLIKDEGWRREESKEKRIQVLKTCLMLAKKGMKEETKVMIKNIMEKMEEEKKEEEEEKTFLLLKQRMNEV